MMTALSVIVSIVLAMVFVMAPLSGDAACLVMLAFLLSLVFLVASSQYDCHWDGVHTLSLFLLIIYKVYYRN